MRPDLSKNRAHFLEREPFHEFVKGCLDVHVLPKPPGRGTVWVNCSIEGTAFLTLRPQLEVVNHQPG